MATSFKSNKVAGFLKSFTWQWWERRGGTTAPSVPYQWRLQKDLASEQPCLQWLKPLKIKSAKWSWCDRQHSVGSKWRKSDAASPGSATWKLNKSARTSHSRVQSQIQHPGSHAQLLDKVSLNLPLNLKNQTFRLNFVKKTSHENVLAWWET